MHAQKTTSQRGTVKLSEPVKLPFITAQKHDVDVSERSSKKIYFIVRCQELMNKEYENRNPSGLIWQNWEEYPSNDMDVTLP